jgi:glycosyltransferase involved in cell wall biosynthesis
MKNILTLTYWSYKDPLIQNYTLPSLRIIRKLISSDSQIYLVTFENSFYEMNKKELEEETKNLKKEGIILVSFKYSNFGLSALLNAIYCVLKLSVLITVKKINYIHCFCTPAGSIGYFLSIITDKPLVLDTYEPHAESMVENGTWEKNSIAFRILFKMEKLQTQRAMAAIALSSGFKEYALQKYDLIPKKFYVKPSCIDLDIFKKHSEEKISRIKTQLNLQDKIIGLYVGKLGGIYLTKEIFDLFKAASDLWGDKFTAIVISRTSKEEIELLSQQSQVSSDKIISISDFISLHELINYMSIADFAVNAVKPVPSKRYCSPIKDGEYWAMGLPIIIPPGISDDSDIIRENNIGSVITSFSEEGYQEAIKKIDALIKNTDKKILHDKIRKIAEDHRSYKRAETIYQEIYGNA